MRTKWLDQDGEPITGSRMTWLDLGILALEGLTATLQNLAITVEAVLGMTKAHYNAGVEDDEFHAEVAQDIETLTEGEA